MMPRMILVSNETSSSAFCATAAEGSSRAATPSAKPKAALARTTFFRRIGFIGNRTLEPLDCRDSCGGSGRFCGVFRGQRLIQQTNNPGNDGYVGEVKNVPIELPIRRRNVEKDEIGDPT